MISVTPEFEAAQNADSAQYISKVLLVLGNYASSVHGCTAHSSGDDASGDYPAAGAIDGDHTEINIGAAATADNGVGKSSWKADAAPDGSGNTYLYLTFTENFFFNRIKLYNLAADPLTSYEIQLGTLGGGTYHWTTIAGTPDRYTPPSPLGDGGFGSGGFGEGPFGGTGNPWPGAGYTGGLDVYDFDEKHVSAPLTTRLRVIIYATQSGNAPQIVSLELYRTLDITDRVKGFNIDRARDLKMRNPLASTAQIVCDNSDKFFSLEYTPTYYQSNSQGFVNAEWPDMGIDVEISEGYITSLGPKLIRTFTGSVDTMDTRSRAGIATIDCRDAMKFMIGQNDSCNLKTAIDIKDALKYVLNRNNVSDYEMSLINTGITLDYFFTYEASILTTMQELVQAAGDALFFFDENGLATFQFFLTNVYNSETISGQTAFLTGTFTNSDAYSIPGSVSRQWFRIDDFSDGQATSNPPWTYDGSVVVTGGYLQANDGRAYCTPPARYTGAWAWRGYYDVQSLDTRGGFHFFLQANNPFIVRTGYVIQFDVTNNHAMLNRYIGDDLAILLDLGVVTNADWHDWMVTRSPAGLFTVYCDGVSRGSVVDTTFSFSSYFYVAAFNGDTIRVTDIYCSNDYDSSVFATTPNSTKARWESATIDQGSAVTAAGTLTAIVSEPAGTSISWYTRTSDDGMSWDPWTAATIGSAYPSTVRRYIQIAFEMNCPADDGTNIVFGTPSVSQIVVAWYFGSGIAKWTSDIKFYLSYDSNIIDLEEQVTDTLGGDTAVINDVSVTSAPSILSGASTDTQWQGTTGSPAAAISAANPLNVLAGTQTFYCAVPGGMDTSGMAGGSAIAITWGTATGTAAITRIHPTKPILVLTITGPGTITDLRLVGKAFTNISTPYQAVASDADSIKRRRRRTLPINNNYVINNNIAQNIADKIIANYKDPIVFIPQIDIWPILNLQGGDQVWVTELVSGADLNYYAFSQHRTVSVESGEASVSMQVGLIRI